MPAFRAPLVKWPSTDKNKKRLFLSSAPQPTRLLGKTGRQTVRDDNAHENSGLMIFLPKSMSHQGLISAVGGLGFSDSVWVTARMHQYSFQIQFEHKSTAVQESLLVAVQCKSFHEKDSIL